MLPLASLAIVCGVFSSPSFGAARLADRRDPVAVLGELRDARVDVAVADVDVAVGVPGDVGRLAELAVDGRPRRRHARPRLGLVRRFLLAAEHHRHVPFGVDADDHVRALVDGPEVVVLVEADGVRVRPGVEALADLAEELAGLVEEQDLRRGGAVGRAAGAVRAREDGDVALRVDGDARDLAEVHVGGQLQEVDVGVEREFREPASARTRRRGDQKRDERDDHKFHSFLLVGTQSSQSAPSHFLLSGLAGVAFNVFYCAAVDLPGAGFSSSFCTRQLSSSAT